MVKSDQVGRTRIYKRAISGCSTGIPFCYPARISSRGCSHTRMVEGYEDERLKNGVMSQLVGEGSFWTGWVVDFASLSWGFANYSPLQKGDRIL